MYGVFKANKIFQEYEKKLLLWGIGERGGAEIESYNKK